MRLLVVEDNTRIRKLYARTLRESAFAVDTAPTLTDAQRLLEDHAGDYDGVVFDLMLPDGCPLELLAEYAANDTPLNAMIVSGQATEDDRIAALRAGAIDFLVKPVRGAELVLRVTLLVSRRPGRPLAVPIRVGHVIFDRARLLVFVDGEQTNLSRTEMSVFRYLMEHYDRWVPAQELIAHCWDARTDPFSNPLYSHISRLRSIFDGKLMFVNDFGGYRVEPPGGWGPPEI